MSHAPTSTCDNDEMHINGKCMPNGAPPSQSMHRVCVAHSCDNAVQMSHMMSCNRLMRCRSLVIIELSDSQLCSETIHMHSFMSNTM